MNKKVAIIGASDNPERYSYKALQLLREHGYEAVPIHPVLDEIEGIPVKRSIESVAPGDFYAVTVYVRPSTLTRYVDSLAALKPEKVILNPGTEDAEIQKTLVSKGVHVVTACTLVLLKTGQFEAI